MLNNNTMNNTLRYFLYTLAVLPIFIFRDFTLDNELQYLSIADEALSNGSIFTFTNHGIIYADKPPLYFWIVMLGKIVFGEHNLLFLGIFSFIPALVILFIMDKWVKNVLSESERVLGQLLLITSGYFIGAELVLRMDMLMCMFIVLSLHTFFRMYSGPTKQRDTLLFPFFVFMALFTSGLIGIIVPLISTTVFLFINGEIKTTGRYWGLKTLVILVTFCGAWFAGVYAEGGNQYINDLFFNQPLNQALDSLHHKEPIYYYFKTIFYSFAPWSLFYAGILAMGLKKKLATTDLERFFLAVVLSTFITLSLISARLEVYMLPVFPFISYLTVLWLAKFKSQRWMRPLIGIPAVIFCLAFPAVIIAQILTGTIDLLTVMIIFLAALILSLSGIFAIKYLINSNINRAIKTMCVGLLLTIFTLSLTIPPKNAFIGMGEPDRQTKKTAISIGIESYYSFLVSRSENTDVYSGTVPEMLTEDELLTTKTSIKKPAVLFLWQLAIE